MRATNFFSLSLFNVGLTIKTLIFAGFLVFAMVASARGQTPTPNHAERTKQRHWQKYVNRKYGFSFWYPDSYKPTLPPATPQRIMDYENLLILLQRRDNSDATIWMILDMRPFNLRTMSESHSPTGWDPDWVPKGHTIGRHIFYFYGAGGGGVEYPDQYFVRLRGKTLEFEFDGPYEQQKSPSGETPQLEPKILRTFRAL